MIGQDLLERLSRPKIQQKGTYKVSNQSLTQEELMLWYKVDWRWVLGIHTSLDYRE